MSLPIVDLRSDTVTRPGPGMRAAMATAEVGDDVYGEDPTVTLLEARVAQIAGKESALFMPSGTQSNLVGLLLHCQRGDEYLVGQQAHTYRYEGGGAAVLGSIQPQPIENAKDGSLALADIRAAIKPDDFHFARTRLLALENTIGGKVLSEDYLEAATTLAHQAGLATHLDGARLFNAVAASGRSAAQLCTGFDSVSICLSKGLGAPAGSVLCMSKGKLEAARRWRKMLGGGMRQAGVLAAAGVYAIDHHIARLSDDHARALRLAEGLRAIDGLRVEGPHTNILFVDIEAAHVAALAAHLQQQGICTTLRTHTRLVTHLDVDDHGVQRTIDAFQSYFSSR